MPNRKLTLLTLDYPPERGGVARYLGNLVEASHGGIKVIVEQGHACIGPGQMSPRELFWERWPRWWPMVGVCRELKKTHQIVLVSHVFPVGTAAWLSRLCGGPEYVVLFHGTDLRRAQTRWKRFLLQRICAAATQLIVNSQTTKHELQQLIGLRSVAVLTPGVEKRDILSRETSRKILGIDPHTPLAISIARVVPRKGLDQAIRAMGVLQADMACEYAIIGDGPDMDRLQEIAATSRTTVHWLGEVSDEQKWMWLAAADVFLLPGRDEGDDVEGFGIVYLEAAQAGVPAVAGRTGGVAEAVIHEQTGILVDPTSVRDIAQATKKLFQDQHFRESLGETARARVRMEFCWQDRWDALLQHLS